MENNWEEEFDKQFVQHTTNAGAVSSQDVTEWEEFNRTWNLPPKVKSFISSKLQEQRQRMAKEIEGKRENGYCKGSHKEPCEGCANLDGYNSGLQAALNIVLGEKENV